MYKTVFTRIICGPKKRTATGLYIDKFLYKNFSKNNDYIYRGFKNMVNRISGYNDSDYHNNSIPNNSEQGYFSSEENLTQGLSEKTRANISQLSQNQTTHQNWPGTGPDGSVIISCYLIVDPHNQPTTPTPPAQPENNGDRPIVVGGANFPYDPNLPQAAPQENKVGEIIVVGGSNFLPNQILPQAPTLNSKEDKVAEKNKNVGAEEYLKIIDQIKEKKTSTED